LSPFGGRFVTRRRFTAVVQRRRSPSSPFTVADFSPMAPDRSPSFAHGASSDGDVEKKTANDRAPWAKNRRR